MFINVKKIKKNVKIIVNKIPVINYIYMSTLM